MSDPHSDRLDAERPSSDQHLRFLIDLFGDPQVARWHWPGNQPGAGPRSAEQSGRLHRQSVEHWAEYGYGWWLWRDRERDRLVARVLEQGRGYATEAAIASLGYAFTEAGLDRVISVTWTENRASLRVMEKAGFEFDRAIEHAGLPHLLYIARTGEWSPP